MDRARRGTHAPTTHPSGWTDERNLMGYGLGIFLLAVGLILALAVQDTLNNIDLTMVGWILAAVGLLAIVLNAVSTTRARGSRTVSTTTHSDGTRTTTDQQQRQDPPPAI